MPPNASKVRTCGGVSVLYALTISACARRSRGRMALVVADAVVSDGPEHYIDQSRAILWPRPARG